MICDYCRKEKETHKFYYGFFQSEYDESKWCWLCSNCQKEFLKCSNVYSVNRTYLIEFYNKLIFNLNNRNVRCLKRRR